MYAGLDLTVVGLNQSNWVKAFQISAGFAHKESMTSVLTDMILLSSRLDKLAFPISFCTLDVTVKLRPHCLREYNSTNIWCLKCLQHPF